MTCSLSPTWNLDRLTPTTPRRCSIARAARLPKGLPVLMVHGAKDDIAPIELGRKLYAALPVEGRQFVELENAGHNDIPYQDSARYLKAVGAFLSERARRAD